jgi:hypothetical protein
VVVRATQRDDQPNSHKRVEKRFLTKEEFMDDKMRTDILHRIFDDAVDSIEQQTDMETLAAHRAMLVMALAGLIEMLCADHLEQELGKVARWIQHERDELRPTGGEHGCATGMTH